MAKEPERAPLAIGGWLYSVAVRLIIGLVLSVVLLFCTFTAPRLTLYIARLLDIPVMILTAFSIVLFFKRTRVFLKVYIILDGLTLLTVLLLYYWSDNNYGCSLAFIAVFFFITGMLNSARAKKTFVFRWDGSVDEALRDAANEDAPADLEPTPLAIGGWLIMIAVWLVISAAVTANFFVHGFVLMRPGFGAAFENAGYLVITLFSVFTAILLFKRVRAFPKVFFALSAACIAFNCVSFQHGFQLVFSVNALFFLLLILYSVFSMRVKKTFVYRWDGSVDEARFAQANEEEPVDTLPAPLALGGWVIVIAAGLVIAAACAAGLSIYGFAQMKPGLGAAFVNAVYLAMALFTAFTAILLFKRVRAFPKVFIALSAACILLSCATFHHGTQLFPPDCSLYFLLLIYYTLNSRRIKKTFVFNWDGSADDALLTRANRKAVQELSEKTN